MPNTINMENFTEFVQKLNDLKIEDDGGWEDSLPTEIWEEYFKDKHKELTCGLDVDTHRWYELSTTVVEVDGSLLGIRHITNLFSESSSHSDIGHTITFMEMKEVMVKSYESV